MFSLWISAPIVRSLTPIPDYKVRRISSVKSQGLKIFNPGESKEARS